MLNTCLTCDGFVPQSAHACPHCGVATAAAKEAQSTLSGIARGALVIASGGALAVTLMACYGAGPVEGPPYDGGTTESSSSTGGEGGAAGGGGMGGEGGMGGAAGAGGIGGAGGAGGAGGK